MLVCKIYKTTLRTSLVCIPNCRRCTMLPQSNCIINYVFSIRAFTSLQCMTCPACMPDFSWLCAVVCIARALSCWKWNALPESDCSVELSSSWSIRALPLSQNTPVTWQSSSSSSEVWRASFYTALLPPAELECGNTRHCI